MNSKQLIFAILFIYNLPLQSQWTIHPMPTPRVQFGLAAQDSLIYLVGGRDDLNFYNTMDIYNTLTGEWTGTTLSSIRHRPAAISAGGKIYIAGGYDSTTDEVLDVVDIYDPTTQEWTLDYLSLGRYALETASTNGKILFAGGRIGSPFYQTNDRVDIYDMENNTWSDTLLSEPRFGIATVVSGNKIYFAGGVIEPGVASKMIDIYDTELETWSLDSFPSPRGFVAGASVEELVLFAGGTSGDENEGVDFVDIYNSATGEWSQANLSYHRAGITSGTVNNKVYFINGGRLNLDEVRYKNATNVVDVFDYNTGSWDTLNTTESRINHRSISLNNKVYVAGGYDFNEVIDIMEEFCPDPLSTVSERSTPSEVLLFPNPASDQINLTFRGEEVEQLKQVLFYDSQGKLVKQFRKNNQQHSTIQLNGLPEGSYFLKIFSNKGVYNKMLVKVKS